MPICSARAWANCSSVTKPMLSAMWPSNSSGPLLLLFEQHFELLVGDESEIDEDLSDASNCHESRSESGDR